MNTPDQSSDPEIFEAKIAPPEYASPLDQQHYVPQPEATRPLNQSTASGNDKLLQSKAIVLAILFLVTGALGIPLLWTNKRFSNRERIIWAILVTLYTTLLILGAGWVVMWSYRQITGG